MAEREKKAAVVKKGEVKVVKKPIGERFAETFFGGTVKDTKAFTVHEIIVPAIKNLVYESFTGALDRLLNGGNGRTGYSGYNKIVSGGVSIFTPSNTSYSSMYSNKNKPAVGGYSSSRNPDMLIFPNRQSADAVLNALRSQILEYGVASVSDMYDFADSSSRSSFTDTYYGWTDLSAARVKPERGGYVLVLPPTQQI